MSGQPVDEVKGTALSNTQEIYVAMYNDRWCWQDALGTERGQ